MKDVPTYIATIENFRTLAQKTQEELLQPNVGREAYNLRFDKTYGSIEKRLNRSLYGSMATLGTSRIIFIDRFYRSATELYTKLLMHCDGDDTAIAFSDETGKTITNNIITIDGMEYATDVAAKAAYTASASGYSANVCTGGTAAASSSQGGFGPEKAFDGTWDDNTNYYTSDGAPPQWLRYDLGAGVTKIVTKYYFQSYLLSSNVHPTAWTFEGSNNATDWTTLDTQAAISWNPDGEKKAFTFTNTTAYRYYRINMSATSGGGVAVSELEMYESVFPLERYSESTIKTRGSYSLKGIGTITTSLNQTLTRTVAPVVNLTGQAEIKFSIRSSRTGSNIKIGFHDSGGTTTESTPNIAAANTWQSVSVDISAVADADKNAIDSIIITQVNADAATTFYIDDIRSGEVIIETSTQEFGTGSAYFAVGSYLSLADSNDWYFGTGDFTIDFWVNFASLTTAQFFMGQYEDANNYWYLKKDTNANGNKLSLVFTDGGAAKGSYVMTNAWAGVATSTWYHLEFARSTTSAKIFIDGTSQTLTETTAFSTNDVGNIAATLVIGMQNSASYFSGYLDEIRVSKGIARHTANFTPAIVAYDAVVNSKYLFATYEDTLKVSNDVAGSFTSLITGLTEDLRWKSVVYKSHWYGCNGQDSNYSCDGGNLETMGVPVPTAPTLALVGGGALTGQYYYKVTYEIDSYQEGNASVTSAAVNPSGESVTVTIPVSGNSRVTARNIYRTAADGAIYYFLIQVANNGDTTYSDNNADGILDTTITAPTDYGAPGIFKYMCLHKSRIFGARVVGNLSRVIYSEITSAGSFPDVFPALNYFDIIKDNGEDVTAILEDNFGQLIVMKPSAVVKINTDTDDPVGWSGFNNVLSINGCTAPYTAVKTPIGIIYLTRYAEGKKCLMLWNGSATTPVFTELEPILSAVAESRVLDMIAHYHHGAYHLSYTDPDGGHSYNDRVLIIDLPTGSWVIDKKNVDCFSSWTSGIVGVSGADAGELYTSSSDTAGLIYHEDDSTGTVETSIAMEYISHWDDFGWLNANFKRVRKRMRSVRIEFERSTISGSLTFSYYKNYGSNTDVTFNLGDTDPKTGRTYAAQGYWNYNFPLGVYCNKWRHRFYNTDTSALLIKRVTYTLSPEPYTSIL